LRIDKTEVFAFIVPTTKELCDVGVVEVECTGLT
jgi:hypothetical protein